MIFGSEGLPRSGKSAESMTHVVDSLRHGRTIVTNISGINHKAISDFLAIPLPTVKTLLICLIPPSDIDEDGVVAWTRAEFLKHAINDCLWIWDEINQFWPVDRQPLPAEWAKFVTEHGHKGIDVLIMGQDLVELHSMWRRRLQRFTRFTKLDMMGKEDHFHWASYANCGRGKFKKTAEGKKPYNKDFFGFYKSHEDDTQNKGNYKDGRFSVFQGKHKFFAALYAAACFAAFWYLWDFFHPDLPAAADKAPSASHAAEAVPVPAPLASSDVVVVEDPPIDYLDGYAIKYTMRLSAIIDRVNPQPGQAAFEFVLDFLDETNHKKESMGRVDVASLGWSIERKPFGVVISKETKTYVLRPWPIEDFGRVSNRQIAALKPER